MHSQLTAFHTDFSPATRARYAKTTLPESTSPLGVVYPTSTDEVQKLVRLARENRWQLHPISRGNNWGYGDKLAPRDGALIVDLSRMNRILEVNEKLAYVVVEPGVTPGQLYAHLQELGGNLWMDANGAGPDTSLVGNFLERGFGHSSLGDRASSFCGMEVVLGTSEIVRTGFGHYEGARASSTYRHGVGPSIDGLFFQSNFGIVTRLGIWLTPKPLAFSGFRCVASERSDLGEMVERIGALRREGIVRSCVHILNPLRALMKNLSYPWDDAEGKRPVSEALRDRWRDELGIGAWSASGAVLGTASIVEATIASIRERLRPFPFWSLDETSIAALRAGGNETLAASLTSSAALLRGIPSDGILRTTAWRSPHAHPTSLDPIENGAGLAWIVPTLPATGEDARRVEELVRTRLEGHGFDAPMTFTFINERTLTCTANISFNRFDERDSLAAKTAYRELMKELIGAGYPPYRCGVGGYDLLEDGSSFWQVARDIRSVLDPDGVLSPDHYLTEKR